MDDWRARQVRTEMDSRDRNEWIEGANDRYGTIVELVQFACECSATGCESVIRLTRAEYEGVRRNGSHFVVARDHENPEIDTLLAESARYSTVSKLGEGARMASEGDPRR